MFDASQLNAGFESIANKNLMTWVIQNSIKEEHGRLLSFEKYPYLKDLYTLDVAKLKIPHLAIKKATQIGVSTYTIFMLVYLCGIRGYNVLYLLPSMDMAMKFVGEKVNKPIGYNPTIKKMIGDTDTLAIKHIGQGTALFHGTNSEAGVQSLSFDVLIVDECDLCIASMVNQAKYRLGESDLKMIIELGNPKIAKHGIDVAFLDGDQRYWHVQCPTCGEWINPRFFGSVVKHMGSLELLDGNFDLHGERDIYMICDKCKNPFDRLAVGKWIPKEPTHRFPSFHIGREFCPTANLRDLYAKYQSAFGNETLMQDFFNLELGETYDPEGDRITLPMLTACQTDYLIPAPRENFVIAGIDPGKPMNVIIASATKTGRIKILYIGKHEMYETDDDTLDSVERKLREYNVDLILVDGLTESEASRKLLFKERWRDKVYVVFYSQSVKPPLILEVSNKISCQLTTNRTTIIDKVVETVKKQMWELPQNHIPFFYDDLMSIVRTAEIKDGRMNYSWEDSGGHSHYIHCMVFIMLGVIYHFGEDWGITDNVIINNSDSVDDEDYMELCEPNNIGAFFDI